MSAHLGMSVGSLFATPASITPPVGGDVSPEQVLITVLPLFGKICYSFRATTPDKERARRLETFYALFWDESNRLREKLRGSLASPSTPAAAASEDREDVLARSLELFENLVSDDILAPGEEREKVSNCENQAPHEGWLASIGGTAARSQYFRDSFSRN